MPAVNAGRQKTPAGTVSPPFRPAPNLTEAPLSDFAVSLRSLENAAYPSYPFGLRALHLLSALVGLCAWTFSRKIRRATSARKLVHFTRSLADKLVVMASGRKRPSVVTDGSADAEAFLADVQAGRGVFVLSSHCGTVEVLAALEGCSFTFHAWMDFDRTSVYPKNRS